MRRAVIALAAVAAIAVLVVAGVRQASAHLAVGAAAPQFTAQAATGGDVSTFDLRDALAKGPVVLYFFPKSFTKGCTIEAHLFSDDIEKFKALGATVVGVSADPIDVQKRFSTLACRSAFPVASDPGLKIAKAYDAALTSAFANRTSYLIAPDGTIAYAYTSLDPSKHVANLLAALRALREKAPAKS